ncbi:MAG: hypothetical protein IKD69_15735 [Solobacterium sp.]|nr:hypothetical protein [Solobacterium sp.]
MEDYVKTILWLKKEQNVNGWNAYDVKAADLAKSAKDREKVIDAMKDCMLEGDQILDETPAAFTVRYYCDNLSSSRRKMF